MVSAPSKPDKKHSRVAESTFKERFKNHARNFRQH